MKYKVILYWTLFFLLQCIVYYYAFRFLFAFEEQLQMFQYTTQYATSILKQAGGVTLYLSEFLTQFYIVLIAGSVITALLLTSIAILTYKIVKKLSSRNDLLFISLLPWLTLLLMHLDYNYLIQGTIAYLFLLLSVWFYIGWKPQKRIFYGIVLIPVLYLVTGPIYILFVFSILLIEFLTPDGNKKYTSIVYLFVCLLTAFIGVRLSLSRNWIFALLPNAYYEPMLHNSTLYYAWYALPFTLVGAIYLKKYKPFVSKKSQWISEGSQGLLIVAIAYGTVVHSKQWEINSAFEQDYYIRKQAWEHIISTFDTNVLSKRRICRLNLALAHTGQLSERLLEYPQQGIETLLYPWDQSVFTAELHSDIYYCMGIISASQKFAFEALVSSRQSGNPRMLKRLVETNIIIGAYAVAEKYISLLETTLFYKTWASTHRRYLYNDSAVQQDKILGLKRQCWKREKTLSEMYTDPVSTLWKLIPGCPENTAGLQYLTSFLLLNKDLKNYKELQQQLYNTAAWTSLSVCQQEAVVICAPNNPHYWLEHGVSVKVRNRALAFMNTVKNNTHRGDLPAMLTAEYGQSYWYYYMFYND